MALVASVDPSYTNTSTGGNHEDKLTTHMESPGSNKLFYYANFCFFSFKYHLGPLLFKIMENVDQENPSTLCADSFCRKGYLFKI